MAAGKAATRQTRVKRLVNSSLGSLDLLTRAVVCHSSMPIFIATDDRRFLEVSFGAGKLLGLPRKQIVGRRLDDFVAPESLPELEGLWQAFQSDGCHTGTLSLLVSGGAPREVAYSVSGSVLPMMHLLVMAGEEPRRGAKKPAGAAGRFPSWVKDCALLLLDADGRVAAWYAGAERIYGYKEEEAIGQDLSFVYQSQAADSALPREEMGRAVTAGRCGSEGWRYRKDGSRFWANAFTIALKDESDRLQGFASVVRDFTDRHGMGQKSSDNGRSRHPDPRAAIGVVSGEFDRVLDASDGFLAMVGYSHEDLLAGRPYWPELTPSEYAPLDDQAYEEAFLHGASTPFEKEYICKNGARVSVLATTSVFSSSPLRWTTFVQDLTRPEETGGDEAPDQHAFEGIVGKSAAVRRVLGQVAIVAPTDATVLILGETGTGKELVARAIHKQSARRENPFITLNCAAIPTGLLESELFGYERGAFTGALSRKIGRFELAHEGTLFLDEVGDIPLDLQPKLLRALQEKEFERLGGVRTIPIDVRLLAATNRNLTQMMGDKLFRSDLYYRLKVFPITAPPLRDHPEDIPLLARHFTQLYAAKMKRKVETIPDETMRALVSWSWPGNVRELENFIERAVILSRGPTLRAPVAEIRADAASPASSSTLEQVDREHILGVLRQTGGVVSRAATRLGMPRTTLNAMMRKLGISRKNV